MLYGWSALILPPRFSGLLAHCTPAARPSITLAPTRVSMVFAVHATIPVSSGQLESQPKACNRPPMNPQAVAKMRNHLLPNLSEILPNKMSETAEDIVQTIENKLELGLGPACLGQNFLRQLILLFSSPISALMTVVTAAAGENPQ